MAFHERFENLCSLFVSWMGLPITSRRQNKKFFDPTIFQKCWRGVGEQPTFAKQMKLYRNLQVKSKRESEESQLPLKSEGCNEGQGFRGNCDSQASWGCAPALPNRIQVVFLEVRFSIISRRRNKKFFDPAIFQKCWRGSGRVALIAARRQRNLRAMRLAHGGGGEKSDRFSRRRTRPPRLVKPEQQTNILQLFRGNSCNGNAL